MGLSVLLLRLNPTTSSYTAVLNSSSGQGAYYSQVLHQPGSRSARFSFLLPDFANEQDGLLSLIDFLCFQSGEMGALNVLAEVEESHGLFEIMRHAGFSVFSWESIWRLPGATATVPVQNSWSPASSMDEPAVRTLFQTLVPPLVQNAEPFTNGSTPRMVYRLNNEILAYVEIISGNAGVYMVPVIHPSVEDVESLLINLINSLGIVDKPVYLQVRSYQAWLSDALLRIQSQPSPRSALLVKHLAIGQLNSVKALQYARSEQRQAEPTAPIMQSFSSSRCEPETKK